MTNNFFKRNERVVDRFIRGFLAKNKVGIVHGGRAQNAQLPRPLERKPTKDWDVFSKNPKLRATQLEKKLDKRFRGDFFKVKKGATVKLKVHKVVSNIDGESVADFSLPDRQVGFVAKRGVRFALLKDQFERAKANVKDPDKKFRRAKDMSLIRRVRSFEKMRRRKL